MDPGLNQLLRWGVENSSSTTEEPSATTQPSRGLDPDVLSSLFGGPSDADLMKASMTAILSADPQITLDDKLIAFDNFEQLIENLDNANNMTPLGLWDPLLSCLSNEHKDLRMMAAWCVGTAVQNNEKSQQSLLTSNGIPLLVRMALDGAQGKQVRRKALYALSSACRNFQPAMDIFTEELGKAGRDTGKVDASDMEACDTLLGGLREEASRD